MSNLMSWTIRQTPHSRDRAPPAATGFVSLVRRLVMRLRWRWAARAERPQGRDADQSARSPQTVIIRVRARLA